MTTDRERLSALIGFKVSQDFADELTHHAVVYSKRLGTGDEPDYGADSPAWNPRRWKMEMRRAFIEIVDDMVTEQRRVPAPKTFDQLRRRSFRTTPDGTVVPVRSHVSGA